MSANCDVIVFFLIYDTWSIKLTFSLIVTFYFTEPKNRTKDSLTELKVGLKIL